MSFIDVMRDVLRQEAAADVHAPQPSPDPPDDITIEPAHPQAAPVFWERATGEIVGPAKPELLAKVGTGASASFWVCCQFEGQAVWINSTVLRSKRQFERQVKPQVVELIREPR